MVKKISSMVFDNLLVILTYYLTAHLSVDFLSVPPSNAAAIWPPTGISLALVLLKGYRVLPAVFIADLIIAIEIMGFSDFVSVMFSLMVGFQAMITAWIGSVLVRRFVGIANPLVDNKSIILFFFLGGPVSVLLPAIFALMVEYWLGMVAGHELVIGFFTWWLGSVIGVIIFAPITLILLGGDAQKARIITIVIPLGIVFFLLVILFTFIKDREQQRLEQVFQRQSDVLYENTMTKVDMFQHELQELKIFVALSTDLKQLTFRRFSQYVLAQRSDISALAWVPRIVDEQRKAFEAEIGHTIFGQIPAGGVFDSKVKIDYFPIKFIGARTDYQTLVGLDFTQNKNWEKTLESAKLTTEAELIMPVVLYQYGLPQSMTVITLALLNSELGIESHSDDNSLAGYVMLFLPFHSMVDNAIQLAEIQQINLTISGLGVNKNEILGRAESNYYDFSVSKNISRLGHELTFTYAPSEAFVSNNSSLPVGWVFIMGLGGAGLVGFTLLSVTGQVAQNKRIIKSKTKDLYAKQQLLQMVIDSVNEGIVASNEKGELTVFNHAAESVFCCQDLNQCHPDQWSECFEIEDLHGVALLEKGENPLLKLLDAKTVDNFEFVLTVKNQAKKVLKINSAQIINENKQVMGIVASFQNITRQKQVQDELKKLSWAVAYSPVSILMTDSHGDIEYVNDKFVEMSGYSLQEVKGQNPRLLSAGKTTKKEYEIFWQTILAGKEWRGEFYNKNKNGVFYWSRQIVAPIINEQQKITHFVAIQEDITEQKKSAEILSHHASHDQLTGLLNRRECVKRLEQVVLAAQLHQSKHVFCFLDLDEFKIVNDSCGHLAGDQLLREVCDLFKSQLRQRDTLVRLGGDEFGIIIDHCSIDKAEDIANKICRAINLYQFVWKDQAFQIGVSIGLVVIDENSINFTTVISQADEACYRAKNRGRGQVCIY